MANYKVFSLVCVIFIVTTIMALPEELAQQHGRRRLRRQRRPLPTPRSQNPSSIGYMVRCQDTEETPGVYNYNCQGAPEDKITLNLEHAVQFQRGPGSGQARNLEPQTLNIIVPNYKIRQVIQPEVIGRQLDGSSGAPNPVNVNILLEKPRIYSERRRQKEIQFDKQEKTTAKPAPEVNIHYEKIVGDKNKEYEFVNPSNCVGSENCENLMKDDKDKEKEGTTMRGEEKADEKTKNGKDSSEKSKKETPTDSKKPGTGTDDGAVDDEGESNIDPRRQDLDMDYQPIEVSGF